MSKKMNLAFTHMREAETARIKLAKIQAGKKQPPNVGASAEAMCECDDNPFTGYSNLVNNSEPTPSKPKPHPNPSDDSCDCGWGYEVVLGMWW